MKILIVDDHPMMSAALADTLCNLASSVECVIAHTGAAAMQCTAQHEDFRLITLDLALPDSDGFDLLVRLRGRCPATPIVVVSASENAQIARRAIAAGAMGYIAKSVSSATLLYAMKQVIQGEVYLPAAMVDAPAPANQATRTDGVLSSRQIDVLRLICAGKSNKFIAQELDLAEKTVKGRITAIFKVLGVVNRTQAALKAGEYNLLGQHT